MKKSGIIILLTILISMTASLFAYGAETELRLTESYPKNGQKNTSVENMGVKLIFSQAVDSEENRAENDKCFTLKDDQNNELPIQIFYNKEDPRMTLILFDEAKYLKDHASSEKSKKPLRPIHDNAVYTLTIDGNFTDNDGHTLGKPEEIAFKTINQKFNTKIYMFMMIFMVIGMVFFSSKAAKKQQEDDAAGSLVDQMPPFNPYKEARRTGKTVEQVIEEHNKEVERLKAKDAKRKQKTEEFTEEYLKSLESKYSDHYRVSRRNSIRRAGGTYRPTGTRSGKGPTSSSSASASKRPAKGKKK